MAIVKQMLQGKGSQIWSVSPDTSMVAAIKMMAEKNVGALIVLENNQCVGIMSERDFARAAAQHDPFSLQTPVSEIMTSKVFYVAPHQTIQECMALMTDKRIRHLPVLQNDELLGVISIGDVVKAMIADQKFTIEQLESYITQS